MNFLKTHKINIIILVFITFLAYINIYQNNFLSDDIEAIVNNKNLGNLAKSSGQIGNIVNSLIFLAFGKSKPAFHFANVLFHTANVIIVYALILQLNTRRLAFPVALIFATHPLHTEVVTWISGRPYAIYSFFVLLSLLTFIIYSNKSNIKFLIISVVSYPIALFSAEKAIILPLLIALYLISFKELKKYLKPLSLFFIITVFFGISMISKVPARLSAVNPSYYNRPNIINPFVQTPIAISSYIELFILPYGLTLYHSTAFTMIQFTTKVVITVIFFIFLVFSFKKSRLLFFSSGLFFLSLLPFILPINVSWLVAERYVYLSSLGLTIIFVWFIYKIFSLLKINYLSKIAIITISVIYLFLTIQRNSDWKSEDTLWPATIKHSFGVNLAHNNMGDYYLRHGDPDSAIKEFTMAINLASGKYPEAMHNLANVYLDKKEATSAAKLYLEAIKLKPSQSESYVQLAKIYYIFLGNPKEAENILIKGIEYSPENPMIYNSLGIIYTGNKEYQKAKNALEKALSLDPQNPHALENLKKLTSIYK